MLPTAVLKLCSPLGSWECFTCWARPTDDDIRSWSRVSPAEGVRTQWQRPRLTIIRVCDVTVSGRLLWTIELEMHQCLKLHTWRIPACALSPKHPEMLSTTDCVSSRTLQHIVKDELQQSEGKNAQIKQGKILQIPESRPRLVARQTCSAAQS